MNLDNEPRLPETFFFAFVRVVNTCTTRGPREEYAWNTRGPWEEYAWNTRFKQTVINDVFNKRFKRFNFVMEHE
jgi:hypothetical protein